MLCINCQVYYEQEQNTSTCHVKTLLMLLYKPKTLFELKSSAGTSNMRFQMYLKL